MEESLFIGQCIKKDTQLEGLSRQEIWMILALFNLRKSWREQELMDIKRVIANIQLIERYDCVDNYYKEYLQMHKFKQLPQHVNIVISICFSSFWNQFQELHNPIYKINANSHEIALPEKIIKLYESHSHQPPQAQPHLKLEQANIKYEYLTLIVMADPLESKPMDIKDDEKKQDNQQTLNKYQYQMPILHYHHFQSIHIHLSKTHQERLAHSRDEHSRSVFVVNEMFVKRLRLRKWMDMELKQVDQTCKVYYAMICIGPRHQLSIIKIMLNNTSCQTSLSRMRNRMKGCSEGGSLFAAESYLNYRQNKGMRYVPVRGQNCLHLQYMNLMSYYHDYLINRQTNFKCKYCNNIYERTSPSSQIYNSTTSCSRQLHKTPTTTPNKRNSSTITLDNLTQNKWKKMDKLMEIDE